MRGKIENLKRKLKRLVMQENGKEEKRDKRRMKMTGEEKMEQKITKIER